MKVLDFYYSRKTEKLCEEHYKENYVRSSFNGIPFTESVKQGKEPLTTDIGDLILIGSGTLDEVKFYNY